ncbi:SUA5/yciO/yrdC domain protein [Thermodesulfobium narugense DSM 14796]|uniref:L-threonylcarbamoyladenylate synthase n=1 Tax=Thermodesulfobium narugense DSM 14796 TaxID=747365 RepID=M1E7I4_9BACT|nr:L-threonylcarbamoyladenylate synthase [Thermodesulfobium narugense]AEE13999.1 SUA5/yciO/yrdC domain protein [Thermodesulfobium narugense DSM 14796]
MKDYLYKRISDQIKNQKIGIVPTDTLFALTGDARSEEVASRIFDVKRRLPDKSFPVFVPSLNWLLEKANFKYVDLEIFLRLSSIFWPGPLTIVSRVFFDFKLSEKVVLDNFLALRVVSHPVINKIFEDINFPIIGTSANISGKINPLSQDEFDKTLLKGIDFFAQGELIYYVPSTVVKLDSNVEVLREGVIKKGVLEKVLSRK